jgi:hypothetical protein
MWVQSKIKYMIKSLILYTNQQCKWDLQMQQQQPAVLQQLFSVLTKPKFRCSERKSKILSVFSAVKYRYDVWGSGGIATLYRFFPSVFLLEGLHDSLFYPMLATCPAHLIYLDLMALIVFDKD